MALKIAINGFGRIGRCVTRIIAGRDDVELVAINDLTTLDMMKYLLDNDSVHGAFEPITQIVDKNTLKIGNGNVKIFSEDHPSKLNFAECGAEVVLECTGMFLTQESVKSHIEKGVKKVIFSAPSKDNKTSTFVLGVNEQEYNGENIISNASCTTNCLAPIAKVLDSFLGIEKGLITTIHSYTNDQNILDTKHHTDKRRSRAAAINMIPTSTGAAKAIGVVMPRLIGKLHGQSVRVPVADVSILDFNVIVNKSTSKDEVNKLFKQMQESELKGILQVDSEYRVSQDFVGSSYSASLAEDLTQVIGDNMIKIMAWYDNEWGYSSRLIDMALYISK